MNRTSSIIDRCRRNKSELRIFIPERGGKIKKKKKKLRKNNSQAKRVSPTGGNE